MSRISHAIEMGSSFEHAVACATNDILSSLYGDRRAQEIWNGRGAASESKCYAALWGAIREYSQEQEQKADAQGIIIREK